MESLKLLEENITLDRKLSILMLLAEGRLEGLHFANEHKGNIDKIAEEIAWYEKYMLDPRVSQGPMKLGAQPRTYRDGYLAALREAMALLHENDSK